MAQKSGDHTNTPAQEKCGIDVEEFLRESGVMRRIQQQAFDCDIKRRAKQHGFEVLKISHRHDPAIEMALYFGTENRKQLRSRVQSKIARLLKNEVVPVPSSKIFSRYRPQYRTNQLRPELGLNRGHANRENDTTMPVGNVPSRMDER